LYLKCIKFLLYFLLPTNFLSTKYICYSMLLCFLFLVTWLFPYLVKNLRKINDIHTLFYSISYWMHLLLGMTMSNTLSWNKHICLLMKKLSKACYIIRNAKTHMSASSLKVVYYAFVFTRLWAMELYFGKTRCIAP